jgi:putative PIN family toxin of toxin-antitoxin system
MLEIVLDTNCFISCIGRKSPYRMVFDYFLDKQYVLCLSTEILLEYEETFSRFWGNDVTHNLLAIITRSPNVKFHSVYYNFNLVDGDKDDNKFADLYISSAADILVTNDSKLLALNKIQFPPVTVMSLKDFMAYLKTIQ